MGFEQQTIKIVQIKIVLFEDHSNRSPGFDCEITNIVEDIYFFELKYAT